MGDNNVGHRNAVANDWPVQLVSFRLSLEADMLDSLDICQILATNLCYVRAGSCEICEKSEPGKPWGFIL
jgi:hypothetical protein